MDIIGEDVWDALRRVDTPSVCNAIEIAQGKRGFNGFTKSAVSSSAPEAQAMVGYARTAKIAGVSPPRESVKVIAKRRMEYFRYMAAGPRPAVCVIEDTDYPTCVGAWWGEVHWTVHKGLNMEGALTNGLMRDLGEMRLEFPVFAGGIGPSHGFVHVREIGTPVEIFGLTVREGDLVHADLHGAVVIPSDIAREIPRALETLAQTEAIILEAARAPGFNIEKLEAAWAAFEKARV